MKRRKKEDEALANAEAMATRTEGSESDASKGSEYEGTSDGGERRISRRKGRCDTLSQTGRKTTEENTGTMGNGLKESTKEREDDNAAGKQ